MKKSATKKLIFRISSSITPEEFQDLLVPTITEDPHYIGPGADRANLARDMRTCIKSIKQYVKTARTKQAKAY